MINEIKIFLFILCIVFQMRFIIQFCYQLTKEKPEPMKMKEVEKTLMYFTTAYIITYIII